MPPLFSGAGARPALVSALALSLVLPATAMAHGVAGVPRVLNEAAIERLEARYIGTQHAAEHAAQRRAARRAHRAPRPAKQAARARLLAADTASESEVGRWSRSFTVPGVAINTAVLRTGKVLYYPGTGFGGVHRERAYLLDPATGATQDVTPPTPSGWTIFCSGTSFLPDGRVLVTGGQIRGGYEEGTPTVFTFDPVLKRWTRHADMRLGRWYPSQVLQPDGRTVILSGSVEDGSRINPDVDVFDPRSGTTTTVAELATGTRPPTGDYYPHLAVLPSGRTLVAGAAPVDSWLFWLSGSTFSTKDVRDPTEKRDFATGVLLPDGDPRGSDQYMVLGGGDYGSTTLATTRTFDESRYDAAPTSAWVPSEPLRVARAHSNTVLLPNGSMVAIGGGFAGVNGDKYVDDPATHRRVELYDPSTGRWSLGPAQQGRRVYHSTAVLLPDGSVMSGGDDGDGEGGGGASDLIEIYEPPYLRQGGTRPVITSSPGAVAYGSPFTVSTSDADVRRAVLMAPGAVTHANDMNQRHVELALRTRADGGGVDLVAPPTAAVAPPGYYMLFLLDGRGVPSVARWIHVRPDPTGGGGTPTEPETIPDRPSTSPAPPASEPIPRTPAGTPAASGTSAPSPPAVAAPVPAPANGTSGVSGSTGTTPTVPRPVLRVVASRIRVHAVRGRRTTLVVRVLRGRVAVPRATVTLRWVGRPISWRVRTDREGRARVVLSGTRAGRLVARVAGAAVEIRVVLRTEPRRS